MTGAHSPSRSRSTSARHPRRRFVVLGVVLVAVAAAFGVTVVAHPTSGRASTTATTATTVPSTQPTASKVPLSVVAMSPVDGAAGVASDATITVRYSVPLAPHSPVPTLTPSVAGTWQQVNPTTMAFVSSAPMVPSSSVTVSVPSGSAGVVGAAGQTLTQGVTVHFGVSPGSTLRLQQLLAQLGYLPVSFTPAGPLAAPQELAQPQEGTFGWRFPEPPALMAQWTPSTSNVLTQGAVMRFEDKHNMAADGQAGPGVWGTLLADASAGTVNADAYNYVLVSKALPQRATVYSNGASVYSTLANTGITGAETAVGTFPVFEHLTVTTMRGTNPDGTKYVDAGIPWVSYFNGGDALHGFVRPGYGYPQSVGCVELPPDNAGVVYPYTPIGTLVTVT